MKTGHFINVVFLFPLLLLSDPLLAQIDRESGKAFATRSEVIGQRGMVAASQPLATQVGLDVLRRGGNAIDAAIATNAAADTLSGSARAFSDATRAS